MSGFIAADYRQNRTDARSFDRRIPQTAPLGQKVDEVPGNHADRRMPNDLWRRTFRFVDPFQERMPAETRVLLESVARRHMPDPMPEQPAQVPDLLLERR